MSKITKKTEKKDVKICPWTQTKQKKNTFDLYDRQHISRCKRNKNYNQILSLCIHTDKNCVTKSENYFRSIWKTTNFKGYVANEIKIISKKSKKAT